MNLAIFPTMIKASSPVLRGKLDANYNGSQAHQKKMEVRDYYEIAPC
jgi:hypothetical protein